MKIRFAVVLGLALITGVWMILFFTAFNNANLRFLIPVTVMTLGVFPILAGCLFHRAWGAVLFPACVLVCLSIAELIYGSPSLDTEPIVFVILIALAYGGIASVSFCAGWIARQSYLAVRAKDEAKMNLLHTSKND